MERDLVALQFLGLCGIYKEACKIIFSFKNIFSQITLPLILPLAFIFLAKTLFSNLLFGSISNDETTLYDTFSGTHQYTTIKHRLSSKRALFWLFEASYSLILLFFSLFSTSAVVYSVACIYTSKPMTFKRVITVVPRVWKKLIITFLWNFLVLLVYHIPVIVVLLLWAVTLGNTGLGLIVLLIVGILYFTGLLYINVIWQLASVMSVLEEFYGIKAIKKSKELIKGKLFAASFIFVVMEGFLIVIQTLFDGFVVGDLLAIGYRVLIGVVCILLAMVMILYGLVVQTVIYFVCKSFHHENIDKSSLSDHLEGYTGDYVRLQGRRDFQLEQINV